MSSSGLPGSLLAVGAILVLATLAGRAVVPTLLSRGDGATLERWGWSVGCALLLLALPVPVSLAAGLPPGWIAFLAFSLITVLLGRRLRLARGNPTPRAGSWSATAWLLLALTALGFSIYAVRSLAEPMWSNDFLAVWGLKGKAIAAESGIPQWLFRWREFEFSNPSYPIGLPLLYAGVAFLLGRWDDHAMAILFPFLQLGTLLVLAGWLRRRGVSLATALAAAAFVAHFGVLYSAWLTGMAEVPASFAFLLVGTALWDVLDGTDAGAIRRLGTASLLAAATKNEGILLVATASALLLLVAIRRRERRLWAGALAAAVPALGSVLSHRLALGGHPTRGLDTDLLWAPGLGARVAETLREEWAQLVRPIWPGIAAVVALFLLAPARGRANPALVLGSVSMAVYLALPVICPFGPAWLVHWTVGRITAALVPLLAAGIAMAWRDAEALPRRVMPQSQAPPSPEAAT